MKKVKKIIIPAQEEHVVEREIYVCDFCGHEGRVESCTICGRHACHNLSRSCAKDDPENSGDYPDSYCPICYDLRFIKYAEEINKIRMDAEAEEQVLIAKIQKESLKQI